MCVVISIKVGIGAELNKEVSMAKSKKMNELKLAKILKELNAAGEVILSKQDEKQSIMDDFDSERSRYLKGRISGDTLLSSVKKTNAELLKLDRAIGNNIINISKLSSAVIEFAGMQAPKIFVVSSKGISLISGSAKKATRKKIVKKKSVKRKSAPKKAVKKSTAKVSKTQLAKEKALDKKYSK